MKNDEEQQPGALTSFYDNFTSFELEGGARCSRFCNTKGELTTLPLAREVKTFWDAFQHGVAISHDDPCLGKRSPDGGNYTWLTYDQVFRQVRHLGTALAKKTQLHRQHFVGIYSSGCPQWLVTALAAYSRSLVVVPLYDTLGADARSYIINQVEMSIVFIDSEAAIERVLSEAKKTPSLRLIVAFQETISQSLIITAAAKEANIEITTLNDFAELSNDDVEIADFDPPTADDLYMIMYTSGTTGHPKGVMHTHQAIVANFASFEIMFRGDISSDMLFRKNEVCLLFLPLAHAYAQLMVVWFLHYGASIGFNSGPITKLMEDATVLRPTFMPVVPRLMNRVYSKVTAAVAESWTKSAIFWYCYRRKKELLKQGTITRSSIWDWLAFAKIQNLIGGRCWLMSVGSAPVSPEVIEFWRIVFGAILIEGYGQTESTACATYAFDYQGGHVGHPVPCNLIKLVDVPDCGYFAKDRKGEVCIKGPNVMKGYYKQPEKTAEVLDADGWLHTGDIGQFLDSGALKLIDRKKHIFKLAQGEYIAPEKVEGVYGLCPLVAQIFVDGDSLQSYTVAVVVPEPVCAQEWAEKNGSDSKLLSGNADFACHVLKAMLEVGKANKLNSIEQVKAIHIAAEPFSPENGLLTPTMKNKRCELRKFFQPQIDALYQAGPMLQ